MADAVVTRLDKPYGQQPETRAAAVAHLVRSGYADILAALGLADVPAPPPGACPYCTTRLGALCVWHGENASAPPAVEQPTNPACPACERPLSKDTHGGWRACGRRTCKDAAE